MTAAPPRWTQLDVRALSRPAALIFNPEAGQKLGVQTNASGSDDVQAALSAVGIPFEPRPTQRAGHATELARAAVAEGRELVVAAGGDGTVNEVAAGLAGTDTALALMPLGSIMNMARTLWIPRDLELAARIIADGTTLAIDLGQRGGEYFLEAAGVGLDAGLFGYFERLESGGSRLGTLRAALRFMRQLGSPRIVVDYDGGHIAARAPMVSVANGPFVGAAYAIAPGARIDDGLLDVVIFRRMSTLRILFHLALVAGGRPLPSPGQARTFKTRRVRIGRARNRRPLPVHLDGTPSGVTPVEFSVAPAVLRVIVGPADPAGLQAWDDPPARS